MLRIGGARFSSRRSMSGDSPVPRAVDASGLKIAIAAARFNGTWWRPCSAGPQGFPRPGVRDAERHGRPGARLQRAAGRGAPAGRRDQAGRVMALGVIIRGGTIHYELIASAATRTAFRRWRSPPRAGDQRDHRGGERAQAKARCQGRIDRGAEFADAAVAMAALRRSLSR
jgi:6,7-dimethyl-8-ribityllumazine synthase